VKTSRRARPAHRSGVLGGPEPANALKLVLEVVGPHFDPLDKLDHALGEVANAVVVVDVTGQISSLEADACIYKCALTVSSGRRS
jgi:hypothetical protein